MNNTFDQSRPATDDFGTAGQTGTMVTALFRDRASAEKAYDSLKSLGYSDDNISVLMSDEGRNQHFGNESTTAVKTELGSKALEGAGTGSAIGGTVGAVLAAIAAIGTSIVLPGLGLIVAGPLAAALAGAGAGGLTGGLIGALIGSGIPEERAKEYETGIKAGGIVLGVKPNSAADAAAVESAFTAAGGESVYR